MLQERLVFVMHYSMESSKKGVLATMDYNAEILHDSNDGSQLTIYDTMKFYYPWKAIIISIFSRIDTALLCFSKNDRNSFKIIEDNNIKESFAHKRKILVKTKIVLKGKDVFPTAEVLKFAEENGYKYFEVSSKTGEGINELKEYLLKPKDYQI